MDSVLRDERSQIWGQLDRSEEKNCEVDNTPLIGSGDSTFRLTVPHMKVDLVVLYQCYTKESEIHLHTRKILGMKGTKKQTDCSWECTIY
jgi:hypothetical protein